MSKTVLVGGGTGFVGSHLCKLLSSSGLSVKVVSRMPGPNRMTWHDIEKNGLPQGTKAVVNLAGQNILDVTQRWTDGFKQNVWNSRVKTTSSLALAIVDAPVVPKAFVTMSGVGIYEPSVHKVYTEKDATKSFDYLSKMCFAWEKAAQLPTDMQNTCRQITIRSGVVLGRNGGMVKQIYWPFYFGLGGPIGSGKQYLPWIHISDLCRFILLAIEDDSMKGVYNGVAPQQITNNEFSKAFGNAMRRPALMPMPTVVVQLMFGSERGKIMTEGQRVIPKRTLESGFGYVFPNIEAACADLVK